VTANPRQRIWAALVDIGLMLAWAALVTGALLLAAVSGAPMRWGPFGYHLFSMVLVVVPATIALTVLESGRYEASPGKHRVGLRLRRDTSGDRVGWARALLRNLLKFGLPWALGQFAVLAVITSPGPDAALGVLFAVAVPVAYLASLLIGGGQTLYDWLTGTTVIGVSAGRRFTEPVSEPEADPVSEPEADPVSEPEADPVSEPEAGSFVGLPAAPTVPQPGAAGRRGVEPGESLPPV
jgi:hypothetical protein